MTNKQKEMKVYEIIVEIYEGKPTIISGLCFYQVCDYYKNYKVHNIYKNDRRNTKQFLKMYVKEMEGK